MARTVSYSLDNKAQVAAARKLRKAGKTLVQIAKALRLRNQQAAWHLVTGR